MRKKLNQLAMLGGEDIVLDLLHYKDSVGSIFVNVGPSDVPSTSRPRGRPRNTSTTTDAPPRPKRRPRKISDNPDAPPRPRGRPRKATPTAQATQAKNTRGSRRGVEHIIVAARERRRGVKHVEHIAAAARERGWGVKHVVTATRVRRRPRKTPLGDIGVARKTPLPELFENPTSYASPNPPSSPFYAPPNLPASPVHAPSNPHASTSERLKIVGMGVLIAENGFTTYNPGFPSSRILHTGSAQPIRAVDITGDLGYKPKIRVRWRDKKKMTENHLEVMRDEMRMNKRQKMASSQSKPQ
ncbi:hypothetical protein FXO38_17327 [Capsicum annuum]|nr:hypothetical protein FXO38_17327 [Capsicum annuum]